MNISSSSKLKGPRPAALKVNKSSSKTMKKNNNGNIQRVKSPVVIYLVSPKIIHVRPEEFMGLVQRLTGKQATANPNSESSCATIMESDNKCANGRMNYEDQVAAYPSLCVDIFANWNDF